MGGDVRDAGDGGVADARGDARGSDAFEMLGVGVFGGGEGIAGGECESGMATHADTMTVWTVFWRNKIQIQFSSKFDSTFSRTISSRLVRCEHNFRVVTIKLFSRSRFSLRQKEGTKKEK